MFLLVSLKTNAEHNIYKIVPLKWIQNCPMIDLLNYGIRYQKKKLNKIFISHNIEAEPNFQSGILAIYNNERNGCYIGTLLKSFGKIFLIFFKNLEKCIYQFFLYIMLLETYEAGLAHIAQCYPDQLEVNRNKNEIHLTDSDVEDIQNELDESDDDDDPDIQYLSNVPLPRPFHK